MKNFYAILLVCLCCVFSISAQTTCQSPSALTAALHYPTWHNVRLNWTAPADPSEQTLSLASSTTSATRIGLSEGPVNLTGAVRFETSDLSNYTNHSLTAVSFIPGESQSLCTYTVKIWRGGSHGSSYNAGTLVYSKVITTPLTENALNKIPLDSAVAINPNQELWIGIQCVTTTTAEAYPLCAASGTSTNNNGELISLGGAWQTLTQGSLTGYTWIIQGTVTNNDNIIDGYNVFCNDNLLTNSPIMAFTFLDSVANGSYHYAVTALYRSGCESDSVTANVTMNDNPCVDCMDSVFVCNGNTETYRLPTSTYYGSSYNQQIYSAAEIGRINGLINCISFQYINATAQNRTMKIYLANTSKNSFANYTDWIPVNEMTLVYDGTLYLNNEGPNHWLNVPLDIPFEWDGSSNLALAVLDYTGNYTTYSENTFLAHTASSKSLYYQSSLTTALTPETSTYSGTIGSIRSNIRFMLGDSITCFSPGNLQVSNITDNGADLTWESRNEYDDYELVVVSEYSDFNSEVPFSVQDVAYTLTGLTENTTYTVYIRSNCSANNLWKTISFKTNCMPFAQLPYMTTFDNIGGGTTVMPDCWLRNSTLNATAYVEEEDTTTHDGYLQMYSYSGAEAYAILPAIDQTIAMNMLQVKFKALRSNDIYGNIEVGVMTDPYNPSTFTTVKTIDATMYSSNNVWNDFIVYLNNYTGNGQFIAFRSPANYTNYVYLDDVEVNEMTGCAMPSNFRVETVTGSSAYLMWQSSDLADNTYTYYIEYAAQDMYNWQTVTTTDNFILLSGLDQLTPYDVNLYVVCDNGSSDTVHTSFLTRCLAGGDINIGTGTTTNSYLPSYSFYCYSYTQQVYTAAELGGANELHSIAFDCASVGTPVRNYAIYLMHVPDSVSTSASTAWLPVDSAKQVFTGSVTWETGWNVIDFDSIFHYNGIDNLAVLILDNTGSYSTSNTFHAHSSTISSRYVYNDGSAYNPANMTATGTAVSTRNNVIFGGSCDSVTSCVPPTMAVTNVTTNSARLNWVPGYQETDWEMEYRSESDSIWTPVLDFTTNTYSFENLTSFTTYQVRMRSLCGDANSDYRTVSFTTSCDYITTLPFVENFDGYTGSGSTVFPECWNRLYTYTTAYPYISTSYAVSGTSSLYLYNGGSSYYSIGVTPRFDDAVSMDSLMISFKLRGSSTSYKAQIGIMNDPNDASSFTLLETIRPSVVSEWEDFEVITRNYHGTGHYIAVRVPVGTSSTLYMDDLTVDYLPSCMKVTNLTVSEIDSASATISWTPGRDEVNWEVIVIPTLAPGDSIDLDTCFVNYASDTYFLVEYLVPTTNYTAFVRSDCGGEYSDWVTIDFQTSQPTGQMPYLCTFEDSLHNWAFANGTSTNQWVVGTAANNGGTHALYVSNDNGATNSYVSTATYVWAYRDIYMPANPDGYVFSFDWKCQGESSYDYMNVYMGTPAQVTAGSSLVVPNGAELISSTMNQSSAYQTFSTILPGNATDGVKRIYFMWHNDGSVENNPPASVDNVSLEFLSCAAPVNVYAYNVTTQSALINWTEIGSANSWDLYYKTSSASSWTIVSNVTPPYLLENLTEGVTYEIYVKSVCDETDHTTSPASFSNTFTVPYSCPQPTNITVSEVTATTIKINWTAGSGETAWTVGFRTSGSSNWTDVTATTKPFTITGLVGSTNYYVRVKANCSATDESNWTEYGTAITTSEAPCPTPTVFTSSNIGPHTATIGWTQEDNTINQWRICFRITGQSWDTTYAQTTSYTFTNLPPQTRVMVRIYALCSSTSISTTPLVGNFTTTAADDTLGIDDYLARVISIYPNPTSGMFTVLNTSSNISSVDIFDVYGQLVYSVKVEDSKVEVDLSDYASGVYFARIKTTEGIVTKRIVKK